MVRLGRTFWETVPSLARRSPGWIIPSISVRSGQPTAKQPMRARGSVVGVIGGRTSEGPLSAGGILAKSRIRETPETVPSLSARTFCLDGCWCRLQNTGLQDSSH